MSSSPPQHLGKGDSPTEDGALQADRCVRGWGAAVILLGDMKISIFSVNLMITHLLQIYFFPIHQSQGLNCPKLKSPKRMKLSLEDREVSALTLLRGSFWKGVCETMMNFKEALE